MFIPIINNRAINTGNSPAQEDIVLEAKEKVTVFGKVLEAGETIKVSRSEAKQIMRTNSNVRVKVD